MNAESENFEALRKLIALKRYEQPPPGYFDQLRCRIILRIEDVEPSFWDKLAASFVFRPAMAYALGLAFCGTVATGLVYALQLRPAEVASQRNPAESWDLASTSAAMASDTAFPTIHVPGYDRFAATNFSEARASLFQPMLPRGMQVSFDLGR